MITKKNTFKEVIEKHPETAKVFLDAGMHCIGCPMAQMETIEQGCAAHGIDVDKIMKKLKNAAKK